MYSALGKARRLPPLAPANKAYAWPSNRSTVWNLGEPIKLDLGGNQVEYSGFGISVPRTGTPLSYVMDVVFPSSGGAKWIYFQLTFPEP